MDGKKDYYYFILRVIADSITILFSWYFAYFLRFYVIPGSRGDPFDIFVKLSILVLLLFLYFLNRNRLYQSMRFFNWLEELQLVLYSSLQSFLCLVVILYFFFDVKVSRISIALYAVMVALFLVIERVTLKNLLGRLRIRGKILKSVLLIGHGDQIKRYALAVTKLPGSGLRIIGQFDANGSPIGEVPQYSGDILEIVKELKPDVVVIGYPHDWYTYSQQIIAKCYDLLQSVIVLPHLPFTYIGSRIVDFYKVPIMYINQTNLTYFQKLGKRWFDFLFSLLALIILSPVMVLVALLVKITSPGPVFYTQQRITEHGNVFTMLKFRSMSCRKQQSNDKTWTVKNDPRITKFGRFIRRTSLDELPQLFNVLKGDMSLIGPRPERPDLVARFINEIPAYQLRHKVKAGMSGWAQVNGWRGNTSLRRRIEFDLFYIRNWSFLFDMKIIFLTFIKGFVNKNAY